MFASARKKQKDKYFEIIFLKEAFEYLQSLDLKHSNKILYNIRKAQSLGVILKVYAATYIQRS